MEEAGISLSCHSLQLCRGLEGTGQSSHGFTSICCKVGGLFLSSKCETWPVRQEQSCLGCWPWTWGDPCSLLGWLCQAVRICLRLLSR